MCRHVACSLSVSYAKSSEFLGSSMPFAVMLCDQQHTVYFFNSGDRGVLGSCNIQGTLQGIQNTLQHMSGRSACVLPAISPILSCSYSHTHTLYGPHQPFFWAWALGTVCPELVLSLFTPQHHTCIIELLYTAQVMYITLMFSASLPAQPLCTVCCLPRTASTVFPPDPDRKLDTFTPRLLFCLIQLGQVVFGLHKLNTMGLLPTHPSDWLSAVAAPLSMEHSYGAL